MLTGGGAEPNRTSVKEQKSMNNFVFLNNPCTNLMQKSRFKSLWTVTSNIFTMMMMMINRFNIFWAYHHCGFAIERDHGWLYNYDMSSYGNRDFWAQSFQNGPLEFDLKAHAHVGKGSLIFWIVHCSLRPWKNLVRHGVVVSDYWSYDNGYTSDYQHSLDFVETSRRYKTKKLGFTGISFNSMKIQFLLVLRRIEETRMYVSEKGPV